MKILDLGCGINKYRSTPRDTVIGMDIVDTLHTDVVHNMENFPYPFKDGEFNMVVMTHALEHVSKEDQKNIKIIEEIHRILTLGGTLLVDVPYGHAFNFDPTHKNPVLYWYWNYFAEDFRWNFYTKARFKLIQSHIVGIHGVLGIEKLTSLFDKFYQMSPPGMERIIDFLCLDIEVQYRLIKREGVEDGRELK